MSTNCEEPGDDYPPCPECGRSTLFPGYGLAGGGIGPYWYCESCDYFDKESEGDES